MMDSSHGRILKVHGLKGSLKASLYEEFKFKGAPEHLFLLVDFKKVPFYLESFKAQGKTVVLHFDEIPGFNSLEEMIGLEFQFPEDCFADDQGDDEPSLVNFKVQDVKHGYLGLVVDILEVGGQFSLIIEGENEVILPFVEEFVLEIDQNKQEILVECPEGLIDLNQ